MKRKTSLYPEDMRHDIDKSEGGGGGGGSSADYSLEEKEVGTFVDGKKMYQKCFFFDTGFSTINCASLNIDNIVDISGTTNFNNLVVCSINGNGRVSNVSIEAVYRPSEKEIRISSNVDASVLHNTFIKVLYTKK